MTYKTHSTSKPVNEIKEKCVGFDQPACNTNLNISTDKGFVSDNIYTRGPILLNVLCLGMVYNQAPKNLNQP
jgi:hypothetical protein